MPERARRRELVDTVAESDGGYNAGRRRTGLRLTFAGGMPDSMWGRLTAGLALLAIVGVAWAAAGFAHRMVLGDERFVLASGSSIATEGNHHLSRAQLVEVFGGDLERNILRVPLDDRKAELEQIPWVRHATVMRLLPDHISVVVEERTPTAFARQAGHMGLVDSGGVLLDMGGNSAEDHGYSFPVVTGVSPSDPLSVRAARMKIFQDFVRDLDASGERVSAKLSEIDLSNPEDVKALIPDHGADVLVHFGDSEYLDRYKKYEAHLGEWRAQYPKLSSVDMRYERQVVLEMQPGTAVPLSGNTMSAAEPDKVVGARPLAENTARLAKDRLVSRNAFSGRTSHTYPRLKSAPRPPAHAARKAGRQ